MKFRSEVSRIAEAFNQRALPLVEIIIVSRKGDIEADCFDRISLKRMLEEISSIVPREH